MRLLIPFAIFILAAPLAAQEKDDALVPRPKVPGSLRLTLRQRHEDPAQSGKFKVGEAAIDWKASQTAIIICDMWDDHYCKLAAQRVGVMVPTMNRVISAARGHGVMIIHAPSGTLDLYEGTPYRRRIQLAKLAKPPVKLESWCHLDPKKEPPLPVDTSKQSCDDPVIGLAVRRFTRQHPGLDIIGHDGVSDNGQEIWNFLVQEGIDNVVLMGVHTNMCVLGRPFGIRQMVRLGKNVVLARDLTDAMYDPRNPPSSATRAAPNWSSSTLNATGARRFCGADLMKVLPGSAGP